MHNTTAISPTPSPARREEVRLCAHELRLFALYLRIALQHVHQAQYAVKGQDKVFASLPAQRQYQPPQVTHRPPIGVHCCIQHRSMGWFR
jgi:hypothetical protein